MTAPQSPGDAERCECSPVMMHKVGCPVVTPPNACEACGVIRNANGICWWCDAEGPEDSGVGVGGPCLNSNSDTASTPVLAAPGDAEALAEIMYGLLRNWSMTACESLAEDILAAGYVKRGDHARILCGDCGCSFPGDSSQAEGESPALSVSGTETLTAQQDTEGAS